MKVEIRRANHQDIDVCARINEVRPLISEDVDECKALCNRVYGCDGYAPAYAYALPRLNTP